MAQQVVHLLERAVDEQTPLSILELRGLGREVWRGVVHVGCSAPVTDDRRLPDLPGLRVLQPSDYLDRG